MRHLKFSFFLSFLSLFLQNERWDVTDLAEEKIAHVFKMFQALLKVFFKNSLTS